MPPRFPHRRLAAEDGFSIVEVLVAAVVLVVGLLGTLTLVDTANTTTFETKAREQATSLQRELIEGVRAVAYDQVTPTSIASSVEGRAALNDASGTAGWSILRRDETYTVSIGTCFVDDPRDGLGAHDAGIFCDPATLRKPASGCLRELDASPSATAPAKPGAASASASAAAACGIDANLDGTVENLTSPGATTCAAGAPCDGIAADYKRVVSLVRWEQGTDRRSNLMVTTIPNPGLSAAPAILTLDAPGGTEITSPGTGSAAFIATASASAASVLWYLDGAQGGVAARAGASWTWTWSFGPATTTPGAQPAADELVDGTYVVGAKAFDRFGQYGSVRSKTMTIDRRRPFAPVGLQAGRNAGVVELEWGANPEGDLTGYRVYRVADGGAASEVCALSFQLACQHVLPEGTPMSATFSYYVVAVDRVGQGEPSTVVTTVAGNDPPNAPVDPRATPVEGGVKLTWGRPDPEDSANAPLCGGTQRKICQYRIYRDGVAVGDRYDRTASGEQLEFTDTRLGGQTHTYFVASVDADLAESAKVQAQFP